MSNFKAEALIRDAVRDSEDLPPLTPEDLPLAPLFWSIVVEPLIPKKKTESGLYLADEARKVEKIQNTVGRVLYVGALSFKGKTSSGLELASDPLVGQIQVGTYVLFARYTGQEVKFTKDGHDRTIIILSDTELLSVVTNPSVIRFWL